MQKYRMYIEGSFVDATSGEWMTSENPYTGDTWAQVARGGAEDADRAVRAAHKAFTSGPWSQLTASQRGLLMHKVGDLLLRDARKLAERPTWDEFERNLAKLKPMKLMETPEQAIRAIRDGR